MPEKGNRDANRTFFGAIVFLSPHRPRFTTTTDSVPQAGDSTA
jgi:hypothetical protein